MTDSTLLQPDTAEWNFACPDWEARLRTGRTLMPTLPLNTDWGDRAVQIFNKLQLPDVVDTPTLEYAGGEWFREIVRALFGSLSPEGAIRAIADVFILVPKKNSKTTYGAALMLTALLLNRRPMARFGLFGPTQEIADLAFTAAAGMVDCDPTLKTVFHVQDHLKTITRRENKASLKVSTFDPAVATGGKYAGWLLDEAHLLSNVPYAARVVRQLRGARMAIHESFGVMITTQSDQSPAGFFKSELGAARDVRDGKAKGGRLLPILYEFPEAMQIDKSEPCLDPANWHMVTPNLGLSVNLDVMKQDFHDEKTRGKDNIIVWASQHLNIQIGLGLHDNRWRGADFWLDRADETLTLDALLARSEVATVGIDGGGLDDLLGLAVIGREKGTGRWLHWGKAWCDKDVLDLRKDIASRLRDFADRDELGIVEVGGNGPGEPSDDIIDLVDIVLRVHAAGLLPKTDGIGLDPAGVASIIDAMIAAEIPMETICGVAQGYKLSGIIAGTARKLKDGTFIHAGQDLMAWCVGNAKAELKGSALLITKQTSGSAKIDPLAALFDAAYLMAQNPEAASGDSFMDHPVEDAA